MSPPPLSGCSSAWVGRQRSLGGLGQWVRGEGHQERQIRGAIRGLQPEPGGVVLGSPTWHSTEPLSVLLSFSEPLRPPLVRFGGCRQGWGVPVLGSVPAWLYPQSWAPLSAVPSLGVLSRGEGPGGPAPSFGGAILSLGGPVCSSSAPEQPRPSWLHHNLRKQEPAGSGNLFNIWRKKEAKAESERTRGGDGEKCAVTPPPLQSEAEPPRGGRILPGPPRRPAQTPPLQFQGEG